MGILVLLVPLEGDRKIRLEPVNGLQRRQQTDETERFDVAVTAIYVFMRLPLAYA